MIKSIMASSAIVCFLSATASGTLFFETGFEGPTYVLGDLGGQDSWMITPMNAAGVVVNAPVFEGQQSVELVDGASFGRAQRGITGIIDQPIVEASFAMYVDDAWGGNMEADRFEAQIRVEATGSIGTFGIEFGFLKAPSGGYETLGPNESAYYIEIGTEAGNLFKGYSVVPYGEVANGWHAYSLTYDAAKDLATLHVDANMKVQISATEDILSLSNIQLQNQRWGTSPSNNSSLYYDAIRLSAVPEPATIVALGLGVATMLRRRSKS